MPSDSIITTENAGLWWEQVEFWRTHLDVFIVDILGIKLKDDQRVIARACGQRTNIKISGSRGIGKTWLVAAIAVALAILYPFTPIAVVSATAQQATLVLKKIRDFIPMYPELLPQIAIVGREPVVIAKDKGVVRFKNGSKIESYSISSVVGERAKIVLADEVARIGEQQLKQNALPVANYTRDICIQNGYEDFDSKIITFTSPCRKSNFYYKDFVETYERMKCGDAGAFACALNWKAAVRMGITKKEYFDEQKASLPESVFATEYEGLFIGAEENCVFPFELTDSVRKLKRVEYTMPKGSKSWYIMSVDLATSSAKNSDNAVIVVIKCTDRDDGSIYKQLVYIRSYNGQRLDDLAEEVRRTYVRFPNTQKIVFDHRGLGDSFPIFFEEPWVDPETDHEYPAWGLDESHQRYLIPMLHSFKANVQLNQELVSALRVSLEQKTLSIPNDSRELESILADADEGIRKEEKAIYIETDALQVEMGNLVMRASSSGNVTYDTAKNTQHKDRYSALAMGVWYISKLETENKRIISSRTRGAGCVGVVSYF